MTLAQKQKEMPSDYLDGVAAKLIMAGFRDIRVFDETTNTLAAFDEWGSEVVIVVHPSNRSILRETNIHDSDN